MDNKHRDVLRRHWSSLRKDLEPVQLLPCLVNVLSTEDEQKVRAKATRQERVDELLEILPRKGPTAFDAFVKALQEDQPFLAAQILQDAGGEEIRTELNRARTHSAKLREEVRLMTAGLMEEKQKDKKTLAQVLVVIRSLHKLLVEKDDKQITETRAKELDATIQRLEEELSIATSDKEVFVEETTRLGRMCDQVDEDLNILDEKLSEKHKNFVENLSVLNNNAFHEAICREQEMSLTSLQDEMVDVHNQRIPNSLEREKEKEENACFHDRATSPLEGEGNQTCLRCQEFEEELDTLRAKMESKQIRFGQLELKHNEERETLKEAKKDTEMKITELIEASERLKVCHINQVKELEQQIETLRREKNEVEIQLRGEKEKLEKELTNTNEILVENLKERLVKAVRRKEQFKKKNQDSSQLIKELEKKNKKLVIKNKDLISKIETEDHETREFDKLKAERDQLDSEIKQLLKEANECQLKCKKLEEEMIKCRKSASRAILPSGRDFSSSPGVVCALKRDPSAKLLATRSSDGPGEASDIFVHGKGKTCGTDEKKGSWWCIDIGENYLLVITHYALRHGRNDGEGILQKWQFQGSSDGITWKNFETRDYPSDHPQFRDPIPYYTGMWAVIGEVGALRYFRILQTGRNSSGKYGIYLSGVELYGVLSKV